MKRQLFAGLMSGTSLDAIDAALIEFLPDNTIKVIATHSRAIPKTLKADIITLCKPGFDGVSRMAKTDIELGNEFSFCIIELLQKCQMTNQDIIAIGSHGQTIRHMPDANPPFTIQIGDANIISKLTGITTVADFRRKDMAYGGQAAPLAPAFHQYLFQSDESNRAIINIGGIANITHLPKNRQHDVIGFDTGPGNTLIDQWCLQHTQQTFDKDGAWAAKGNINPDLLKQLLNDPYFKKNYPKSTGREYFNLDWLEQQLAEFDKPITATNIQATLTDLTAKSIANAITDLENEPSEVFICGGGAHNQELMHRLQSHLPSHNIKTTESIGLNPNWVEAATFAWLAKQTINHQPGNLPSVTGAEKAVTLGAIYPSTNQ